MMPAAKATHDLQNLEEKITQLQSTMKQLSDPSDFEEMIRIIHQPGFTTPAELRLILGLLESLDGQARTFVQTKQALLDGSRSVSAAQATA